MNSGDIGGFVGGVAGGGLTAKLIGNSILATTLGPAYIIGATLAGYYMGHQISHSMSGSKHH